MIREILFRGKSLDKSGAWVLGSLIHRTEFYGDPCDDYFILYGGEFDCDYYDADRVNPETVGQFTGLFDRNGKKIFEGDIIHAHYANAPKADFVEQVVFCDGRFCSLFSTIDGSGKMWSALPFSAPHIKNDKSIHMEWCEVIGNIHDNPELIKNEHSEIL